MNTFDPNFIARCAAKAGKRSGVDMDIQVDGGLITLTLGQSGKKPEDTKQTITVVGDKTKAEETNEKH